MADISSNVVLDKIKQNIIERKMRPGDKLPTERHLAELLSISRHSVREALKNLQALDVVEIIHGSGVYLKEQDFSFLSFPIKMALQQGNRTLEDLFETRELIEIQIITLACERFSEADIQRLDAFLQQRATAEAIDYYQGRFDFEFERIIGDMCANKYLAAIQRLTHILWEDAMRNLGVNPVDVTSINMDHANIVDALREKDLRLAKKSMKYHLKSAQREYHAMAGRLKYRNEGYTIDENALVSIDARCEGSGLDQKEEKSCRISTN
jgi:GntR family transcriptional regulator, transcriptional repressor for pyruvate dehydrogenase complex